MDDTERAVRALLAVLTNFSCIPLAVSTSSRGFVYEPIIGLSCAFTSIMYHVGELYEHNPLYQAFGLTSGQWHRLDNVFSISSFNALLFYFMEIKSERVNEALRWLSFIFTLYCQEKAPWDINYTALPILVPLIILIGKYVYTRTRPEWIFGFHFAIGMLVLVFAIYFFVKGLDDANDWYRINHCMWHFFIGFAFYFLFHSRDKLHRKPTKYLH